MNIVVTRKSNIDYNAEGNLVLRDPDQIGYLRKTHVIPMAVPHPETGDVQHGVIARAEVYWEEERSPAFTLEDPQELVWVSMDGIDEDDNDDEDDDDEDEEYEEEL